MEILEALDGNDQGVVSSAHNISLKVKRNDLLRTLLRTQGISNRRSVVPILSNVMLEASGNELHFTATNMNISLKDKMEAEVSSSGKILVNSYLFCEIVRKLSESSDITIKSDQNNLLLESDRSKFELPALTADSFPTIEEGDFPISFTMGIQQLYEMLDKTHFAASNDETRHSLSGINLKIDGKQIVAAATDGHRLARFELTMQTEAQKSCSIIIPKKTIMELTKILKEETGDVTVSISENKIKFQMETIIIVSKLIGGSFPQYESVIPDFDKTNKITINNEQLSQAIGRVSLISAEKTRGIKCTIENNLLCLSAAHNENGKANETVITQYQGESVVIGFNSKYLLDALSNTDSENIDMLFSAPLAPVRISNPKKPNIVYVVMPMRI